MTKEYEIRKCLGEIWSDFAPSFEIHKDGQGFTIEIDSDNSCVGYDHLEKLSTVFGTKRINLTSETRSSGGCETCNFEWGVTMVEVKDVTRWPSE